MKCLIAGNNVKVLARAIHSLAKIGDELHIEPSPDGLILKTVNSSKSAYGDYRFHLPFFLSFSCISENTVNPNDGEELVMKCKLPMKSILSVFRSIGNLEKSVETCQISLPVLEALLIIEFKCKYGIVKLFNLRYFETTAVDAQFARDSYASKFNCSSRFYNEALQSFHSSTVEVTWSLALDQVHISNYLDDELEPSKCVRTEITVGKEEFEDFNVAQSTKLTFCLKELRAILAFAEPLGLQLQCRMGDAGEPVLFSLMKDDLFSADFLMATLTPSNSSANTPSGRSGITVSNRETPISNRGTPAPVPTLRNQSSARSSVSRVQIPSTPAPQQSTLMMHTASSHRSVSEHHSQLNSLSLLEPRLAPFGTDLDSEEEANELQDLAPPAKRARARYIFQRCLKSTQEIVGNLSMRSLQVLAPPSDGEED